MLVIAEKERQGEQLQLLGVGVAHRRIDDAHIHCAMHHAFKHLVLVAKRRVWVVDNFNAAVRILVRKADHILYRAVPRVRIRLTVAQHQRYFLISEGERRGQHKRESQNTDDSFFHGDFLLFLWSIS